MEIARRQGQRWDDLVVTDEEAINGLRTVTEALVANVDLLRMSTATNDGDGGAEAIVSSMVGQLGDKLSSYDLVKFARQEKVSNEFNKLGSLMAKIQSLLQDADEKQMSDTSLRLRLDHLTYLAYDLEDILDEFATRNLEQELMNNPSRLQYKLRYFFYSFGNEFNVRMGSKFKLIYARLEDMLKQKEILQLREIVVHERKTFIYQRLPYSSLVESDVLGRENDKKSIIELLFSDKNLGDGGDDDVGVIPIYGMGGIGKTTLMRVDSRSKIIVTTRNKEVGSIMGMDATCHLKLLSYEDCFSLFQRHALGNRFVPLDLKAIGEEIVKSERLALSSKNHGRLVAEQVGSW